MQVLARLGVTAAFGVFTVGVVVVAGENALNVIRGFDDYPEIYEGAVVTIIAAAFAAVLSLLSAAFDRSLWWIGRNSCLILASSLFFAPIVFARLAFPVDSTNYIVYNLGAEIDLVVLEAFGIVASLAVMLLLGIAALARRFAIRRQHMDPIDRMGFD